MEGLTEGRDPHLFYVGKMVERSWTEVMDMTICRCCVRSRVLPISMSDELSVMYKRMQNIVLSRNMKELVEGIKGN